MGMSLIGIIQREHLMSAVGVYPATCIVNIDVLNNF
jgi:hypothetical protein